MHLEWLAVEHYRLHVVEEWPDGPHKHAALAGIHSTLESLTQGHPEMECPPCEVCSSRGRRPNLDDTDLAA
jgi:hypothetical protein